MFYDRNGLPSHGIQAYGLFGDTLMSLRLVLFGKMVRVLSFRLLKRPKQYFQGVSERPCFLSGMKLSSFLKLALAATSWSIRAVESAAVADPCAGLAGRKWVNPAEVRACFASYKVDPAVKENVGIPTFFYPNLWRLFHPLDHRGYQ